MSDFIDVEVTNDPHRLFCPHVDCGYVLSLNDARKIHQERPMTCTKVGLIFLNQSCSNSFLQCQTTFCLKCRSQWHPHEHCSDLLYELSIH